MEYISILFLLHLLCGCVVSMVLYDHNFNIPELIGIGLLWEIFLLLSAIYCIFKAFKKIFVVIKRG